MRLSSSALLSDRFGTGATTYENISYTAQHNCHSSIGPNVYRLPTSELSPTLMRFCENSRCRSSRCRFNSASLAFFASISSFLSCIFRSAIFALPAGSLLSTLSSSSSPLLLLLLLETAVLNRVVCPTACLEPLLAALLSSLALNGHQNIT